MNQLMSQSILRPEVRGVIHINLPMGVCITKINITVGSVCYLAQYTHRKQIGVPEHRSCYMWYTRFESQVVSKKN